MSEKREYTLQLVQDQSGRTASVHVKQGGKAVTPPPPEPPKPVTIGLRAFYHSVNAHIQDWGWSIGISYTLNGKDVSVPFEGKLEDIPTETGSLESSRVIPTNATNIVLKNNTSLPKRCVNLMVGSEWTELSEVHYADTAEMISAIGETPRISVEISDRE